MTERPTTTWDGLPASPEPPYAACVVVWRWAPPGAPEFLVLHRLAPGGPGFEGDWAWTPPSGARLPGEPPDEAAKRELLEETGLRLPLDRLRGAWAPSGDVALYVGEAMAEDQAVLDDEHDRAEWLSLAEAVRRCRPQVVGACLERAAAWLAADPVER